MITKGISKESYALVEHAQKEGVEMETINRIIEQTSKTIEQKDKALTQQREALTQKDNTIKEQQRTIDKLREQLKLKNG